MPTRVYKYSVLLGLLAASAFGEDYRELRGEDGEARTDMVQRVSDSACIPADTQNRDYKAYLDWKNKGGDIQPPVALEQQTSQVPLDTGSTQLNGTLTVEQTAAKTTVLDETKPTDERLNALIDYLQIQ